MSRLLPFVPGHGHLSLQYLLIADDNAVYRHALLEMLEAHHHLEVVGEATDGEDAILRAEELQPAIVGIRLPVAIDLPTGRWLNDPLYLK